MGALRRVSGGAEIKRMRVHPDWQRRGFGRRILRLLEERAIELGYRRLVLDVGPKLTAALDLYAAEGFVEVGRAEIGGTPAILLAKSLT
jgi:ribosomal protein S18 acetylase RimI-like enzyme